MRIRYAYKLELGEGKVAYKVIDHVKSEDEVKEMFAKIGCEKATFHDRIRTGYKVNPETGEITETGLAHKNPDQPQPAPASPEAPKSKKAKKAKKAE